MKTTTQQQGLSGCSRNGGSQHNQLSTEAGGECPKCKRLSVVLYRVVDEDKDKLLYTWLECLKCGWRNHATAH